MRSIGVILLAALLLPLNGGRAYGQDPPEPFLLLEVTRACATAEQDRMLAEELELRMPGMFLVRGSVGGAQPDWRITWRPVQPDGCELVFISSGNSSTMELGPNASAAEIQLAASRVAWLASISPSRAVTPALEVTEIEAVTPEPEPTEVLPEPEPEPREPEPEEPEPTLDSEPDQPAAATPPPYETIGAKLSILPSAVIYPSPLPKRHAARLSVNVVGGTSYGLEGIEMGGAFNRETGFARGVQLALGANLVEGDADALQMALGFNSAENLTGAQLALGLNRAGDAGGLQLAAVGNVATGKARGVQAAIGFNLAHSARGLQLGALNLAGPVEGAQVGLVNVAKTSDISLGLVNILYGEPLYLTGWGTSIGGAVFGLQHGGRYVRYAYLGGVDAGLSTATGKVGLGLGGHIPIGPLFLDGDFFMFWVVPFGEPLNRVSLQPQLKASVGWQIARRFAVFGGVTASSLLSGLADPTLIVPGHADEIPTGSLNTRFFTWPELHAGIRF